MRPNDGWQRRSGWPGGWPGSIVAQLPDDWIRTQLSGRRWSTRWSAFASATIFEPSASSRLKLLSAPTRSAPRATSNISPMMTPTRARPIDTRQILILTTSNRKSLRSRGRGGVRFGALRARGQAVEDQIGARHHAGVLAFPTPLDDPVGADDDQRAVRHAARLEVGTERARRRALRLEVRELEDRHAERLAERALGVRRVAGDPEQPRTAGGEVVQDLLVDLQLVGADGAEGERVEDQDRGVAEQVGAGERLAFLVSQLELGCRRAGSEDAQRRSPSSLMRAR